MKVLVTGGAGYIGSTLVPMLLGNGHQVRVLDSLLHGGQSLLGVWANPKFEFFRGDIRDSDARRLAIAGVDAVIHLAAIVGDPACARQPEEARQVNLDASIGLIQNCKESHIQRLIVASTCSNYGKMNEEDRYVDERSQLTPVSLYARTKVQMEELLLDRSTTTDLCATSLRFATVFGVSPRMRFDLTVNEFAMEMLAHKRITVFGEQFWRPYIHVRDAARAISMVLDADSTATRDEVFNVGSTEQNYTKKQLVQMIQEHVPDAEVEYVHKEEDPRDYRVSFAKIESKLGFRCSRSVEKGIEEIVALVRTGLIDDFTSPSFRN